MSDEIKKSEMGHPIMPADLYWEYRCTIEEVKLAKMNIARVNLEQELKNKDLEMKKLQMIIYRDTVKASRVSLEKAEAELDSMKSRIEQRMNMSIDNVAIDPITLEVKQIEDNKE